MRRNITIFIGWALILIAIFVFNPIAALFACFGTAIINWVHVKEEFTLFKERLKDADDLLKK